MGELRLETATEVPPGVLNESDVTPDETDPPAELSAFVPARATELAVPQLYGSNATVWNVVTTPPDVASPARVRAAGGTSAVCKHRPLRQLRGKRLRACRREQAGRKRRKGGVRARRAERLREEAARGGAAATDARIADRAVQRHAHRDQAGRSSDRRLPRHAEAGGVRRGQRSQHGRHAAQRRAACAALLQPPGAAASVSSGERGELGVRDAGQGCKDLGGRGAGQRGAAGSELRGDAYGGCARVRGDLRGYGHDRGQNAGDCLEIGAGGSHGAERRVERANQRRPRARCRIGLRRPRAAGSTPLSRGAFLTNTLYRM